MSVIVNMDKYIVTMYKALQMKLKNASSSVVIDDIQRDINGIVEYLADQGLKIEGDEIVRINKLKYKVGDWIVWEEAGEPREVLQVTFAQYNTYEFSDGTNTSINDEKYMRAWTIQDAKDGDVLAMKTGRPFIFKGLLDKCYPKNPVAYCGIDSTDEFFISTGDWMWTDEEVYPATKEQCDLLFKKMHEAGYEWDAEKKELKKIDEKPSESIKEYDFHGIKFVPKFAKGNIIKDKKRGEISTIEDFSYDTGLYTHTYGQFPITIQDNYEIIEPKQKWSDEDEKILNDIITDVKFEGYNNDMQANSYKKINWLKDLKERYTWKPDERQIRCVGVLSISKKLEADTRLILDSLYQDLLKLRKE